MDTTENKNTNTPVAPTATPAQVSAGRPSRFTPRTEGDNRSRGPRKPMGRSERPRSEFEQKMLNIRRVARVATGGRRFQFSVAMVAGDKKGRVGVGLGKANDTSLAIDKALRDAKKNMVTVNLTKTSSIAHEVSCKYSSARVVMRPSAGRGIVAGSAVRNVLELAGVKDVSGKILSGSKNKLNIARAAVQALSQLEPVVNKTVTQVAPKTK